MQHASDMSVESDCTLKMLIEAQCTLLGVPTSALPRDWIPLNQSVLCHLETICKTKNTSAMTVSHRPRLQLHFGVPKIRALGVVFSLIKKCQNLDITHKCD